MASRSYSACVQQVGALTKRPRRSRRAQRGTAHLLHLEHVLVKVLLQLLVGQVDAELLKVVLLELLKPCAGRALAAHERQSVAKPAPAPGNARA